MGKNKCAAWNLRKNLMLGPRPDITTCHPILLIPTSRLHNYDETIAPAISASYLARNSQNSWNVECMWFDASMIHVAKLAPTPRHILAKLQRKDHH